MAARSIGSAALHIDHVVVPVKYFTAASEKAISMNMLHGVKVGSKRARCGSRVKQISLCEAEEKRIERSDVVWGYEYEREKFVMFTADELKAIEIDADPDVIRIEELFPAAALSPMYVRKAKYLGPDKGAARAYRLVAVTLERLHAVAIGQIGGQRRDELVAVAPHEGGLALLELFYGNEVRSFEELEVETDLTFTQDELRLANELFGRHMTGRFHPDRFTDEAPARFGEYIARKLANKEMVVPKPAKAADKMGLVEQLRASLERGPRKTRGAGVDARRTG